MHPSHISHIEGVALDVATVGMLGSNVAQHEIFPVLIKLIDAQHDLSVQVHPDDSYAMLHEGQLGKTEMWYILDAEPGCGIYLAFDRAIDMPTLEQAIASNTLCDHLHFVPVQAGQFYMIPSGTVHAIGKGVTLLEIQQNSDITYRLYDYGRLDANGNPRQLRLDKAKHVADLSPYCYDNTATRLCDGADRLAQTKYFTVDRYNVDGQTMIHATAESFNAVTITHGAGTIDNIACKAGDTYFVPAGYGQYTLCGNMQCILTKV